MITNLHLSVLAALIPAGAESTAQDDPSLAFIAARLDTGQMIAGTHVVTQRDLLSFAYTAPEMQKYRNQVQTREMTEDQLFLTGMRDLALQHLETDAGIARGFPLELVEQRVDAFLEDQIVAFGGHHAFSQQMDASGLTVAEYRASIRDQVLQVAWRNWARGVDAGPKGRRSVDRYIRPGQLAMTYEQMASSPSPIDQAVVGAAPTRYKLQRIRRQLQPGQDPQSVLPQMRSFLEQVRESIIDGESNFEGAQAAYHVLGSRPDFEEPLALEDIRDGGPLMHGTEALAAFVLQAVPGEISDPIPVVNTNDRQRVSGFELWTLVEVIEPTTARPFEDLATQQELESHMLETLDDRRLRLARLQLLEGAHVYPDRIKAMVYEVTQVGD